MSLSYYRSTSKIRFKHLSFCIVMTINKINTHIQEDVLWYILFVHNVVLVDESRASLKLREGWGGLKSLLAFQNFYTFFKYAPQIFRNP